MKCLSWDSEVLALATVCHSSACSYLISVNNINIGASAWSLPADLAIAEVSNLLISDVICL